MTIYLVVIKDQHTDDAYEAFVNREAAIAFAKEQADGYGYTRSNEELFVDHAMSDMVGSYCFAQTTSCEGDRVEVVEVEIADA